MRLEPHKPLQPPIATVKSLYSSKKLVSCRDNPQDYFKMLNKNRQKYTIKFNHLYQKTLKYSVENVFKQPEKEIKKENGDSDKNVQKTLARRRSIISQNHSVIEDEKKNPEILTRRKSLDQEHEKEMNALRIFEAW